MRSLFSGAAATWFIFNALTFVPQSGGVGLNPSAPGGFDGDPAGVAVTWAARQLFVGLALLALALVEWREVGDFFGSSYKGDASPHAGA